MNKKQINLIDRNIQRKEKAKAKKILKLRRRIAAHSDRKGFAFDIPQCSQSDYDSCQSPHSGLEKARMLLSYFDGLTNNLRKFIAIIHTDQGYYRLKNVESIICDYAPGSEHIEIKIVSSEALQKVTILGFKILDNLGKCIYTSSCFSRSVVKIGIAFVINYHLKV